MKIFWIFSVAFIFLSAPAVDAKDAKGSIPLDAWTFDKILPLFRVSLVKFDRVFPYGDKHDEYIKVAEAAHMNKDLVLAEVNIADYGDKKNADLGERFHVTKDDFPQLKLFVQGNEKPIDYKGNWQADDIKRFLKVNGGVWVGLTACIEEFDEIARLFSKEADAGKRESLLKEAESKLAEFTDDTSKKSGQVYIHTMKKILEKGNDYVNNEIKRVEKLKEEKISELKKEQFQHRVNILHSFKDEL